MMRQIALVVGLTLVFASCGTARVLNSGSTSQPVSKIECVPPQKMKRYTAFHIEQVHLLSGDRGSLVPVEGREVRDLEATFREKLIRALGDRYTAFNHPTSGVALVEISIVDISSDSAILNLRPGMIVPNAYRGGATMQASITDSVTGATLCEILDSRQGGRQGYFSGLGKWDGAKNAFEEWAQMIARL